MLGCCREAHWCLLGRMEYLICRRTRSGFVKLAERGDCSGIEYIRDESAKNIVNIVIMWNRKRRG